MAFLVHHSQPGKGKGYLGSPSIIWNNHLQLRQSDVGQGTLSQSQNFLSNPAPNGTCLVLEGGVTAYHRFDCYCPDRLLHRDVSKYVQVIVKISWETLDEMWNDPFDFGSRSPGQNPCPLKSEHEFTILMNENHLTVLWNRFFEPKISLTLRHCTHSPVKYSLTLGLHSVTKGDIYLLRSIVAQQVKTKT